MRRGLAFALLALLCIGGAAGYVVLVATRSSDAPADLGTGVDLAALHGAIVFRATDDARLGSYGRVSVTTTADLSRARSSGLRCDRVDFAAGHGLCLDAPGTGIFTARILDARMRPRATVPPARAAEPRAGVAGRALRRGHRLRLRTLLRAGDVLDADGDLRPRAPEGDRRRRELPDAKRRPADGLLRSERLGRDVRRARRAFLRHGEGQRHDAPDRGRRREPHGAHAARQRRVPVALARWHAHRLQEDRRRRAVPGGFASSISPRCARRRCRRRARSTTRSSGSTIAACCTPSTATSGSPTPTVAAGRGASSRTPSRRRSCGPEAWAHAGAGMMGR